MSPWFVEVPGQGCAEHPDSAKNWHYQSVTGRLSFLLDSANSWHYRSVSLGEAFGGSLTTDSAKKLALFRCKSGYRDFLCMLKLVVSKGRYEWAVRNIEEKTYFLGKIHYYFIFYSLALVLALHTYDCHLIKQSQKSYALKNFHLLRLRNNYINHKNLK